MVSKRFNYLENPQSLFHPIVRNEEEVYSLKHFYTPKPTIQPSNEYSKSKLSEIVDHQWMKDMDFRLVCKNTPENSYGAEIEMVSNPLQWFKSIEKECTTFNIDKKDLKLVAFDLETTGLNVNVSFIGGQIQRYENLVGLCLAIKGDQGFYLPISHTEQDGVVNWTTEEIKELIDYLTNDEVFHLIVHNAQYDLTILRTYGWKIPKICSDTMIIHKLMNNYEFHPFNIKNGLKQLSEFLLKRKMIEINSFFGEKEMIEFNRLPATMAYSYGCLNRDTIITVKETKFHKPISVKIGEAKQYEGWLVDTPDGWVKITKWLDQGVKETIKITMEDGTELICTPDHKIETYNRGWVEAQHLTEDDDIIMKDKQNG